MALCFSHFSGLLPLTALKESIGSLKTSPHHAEDYISRAMFAL